MRQHFHYQIYALLLILMGCKNINSSTTSASVGNMPFDHSIYLTIPHAEEQSILRRKLLNIALLGKIKKENMLDESSKIKNADEFNFSSGSFPMSSINSDEYKKNKGQSAEIIVSYKDRLEIYFVPSGIDRSKALAQLDLTTEPGREMLWGNPEANVLFKNNIYYMVSASKADLMQNDVHFSQQEILAGDSFNEKMFSFSRNQIVEMVIGVSYAQKETKVSQLKASSGKCTRDRQEASLCGACTYKMETPTGNYIERPLASSELVDLDIIINGRVYPLVELKPILDLEGKFKVTLNLKDMVTTDLATIQIIQNIQYPVLKTIQAFDIDQSCVVQSVNQVFDLTPSVKMNLNLNVKGRVLYFSM